MQSATFAPLTQFRICLSDQNVESCLIHHGFTWVNIFRKYFVFFHFLHLFFHFQLSKLFTFWRTFLFFKLAILWTNLHFSFWKTKKLDSFGYEYQNWAKITTVRIFAPPPFTSISQKIQLYSDFSILNSTSKC